MYKDFSLKKSHLPNELLYLDIDKLLLLPTGEKTVTISDPKNLNIIDSVLQQDSRRLIAVIPSHQNQFISDVGCAGKIISFVETNDGKYIVNIMGVCRFHVDRVVLIKNNSNKIIPIWCDFLDDLDLVSQKINDRKSLNNTVYDYFNIYDRRDNVDLSKINQIPDSEIIALLATNLDYDTFNQKKLINAKDLNDISNILQDIMETKVAQFESKAQIKH